MRPNFERFRTRPGSTARWNLQRGLVFAFLLGIGVLARGETFAWSPEKPTLDRWFYPFNFEPGVRRVAPTYGSFDYRFDMRDAQFLLGWDTGTAIPTNAGPSKYLIQSARILLTSILPPLPNRAFVYDPTPDHYLSYLTNQPGYRPDDDPGRPVELFGVGYRGGFDAETFLEGSPYGAIGPITSTNVSIRTRNAYAAAYDTNGVLVDVANNIGHLQTNWNEAAFPVHPWAIGTTTAVPPGGEVPNDAKIEFAVDLTDPQVLGYLQSGLHEGRLRLMVSSLSPANQSTAGGTGAGGGGAYPWWSTKENLLYDPPRLELSVTVVTESDTDGDQLPDDWERFWFGNLTETGPGDPDADGASNEQEFEAGTSPKDSRSVFRLSSSGRDPDGKLVLEFPFAASRRYVVEQSADLTTWSVLAGRLTFPDVGLCRWMAESASSLTGAFFVRVRAN
ncbi:MAG: hypothetical protein JNK85_27905 [Verrucomicrobiales bacterium]|nr:hypothetical protein [Verrucomicrobiales bacterium]